jgi:hypothetical protein
MDENTPNVAMEYKCPSKGRIFKHTVDATMTAAAVQMAGRFRIDFANIKVASNATVYSGHDTRTPTIT